jgi:hypothetical protein
MVATWKQPTPRLRSRDDPDSVSTRSSTALSPVVLFSAVIVHEPSRHIRGRVRVAVVNTQTEDLYELGRVSLDWSGLTWWLRR